MRAGGRRLCLRVEGVLRELKRLRTTGFAIAGALDPELISRRVFLDAAQRATASRDSGLNG